MYFPGGKSGGSFVSFCSWTIKLFLVIINSASSVWFSFLFFFFSHIQVYQSFNFESLLPVYHQLAGHWLLWYPWQTWPKNFWLGILEAGMVGCNSKNHRHLQRWQWKIIKITRNTNLDTYPFLSLLSLYAVLQGVFGHSLFRLTVAKCCADLAKVIKCGRGNAVASSSDSGLLSMTVCSWQCCIYMKNTYEEVKYF